MSIRRRNAIRERKVEPGINESSQAVLGAARGDKERANCLGKDLRRGAEGTKEHRLENLELKRGARRDMRVVEDGTEQIEPSVERSI